ncbi:MAG: Ig-like domain-containing protein [Verrucomicrobia bacterium]|nr:Ig-like domain-containing protein [Verrucomicrobiota bacterium]
MKRQARYLRAGAWLAALLGPLAGPGVTRAATVWTGPLITFTRAANADPTQAANQDRITANTWLTRGASQGLYNAKTETSFTHYSSPANTRWANGTIANYASLTYYDWNTWAKTVNGGPPYTIGKDAVLHLLTEDIYLAIKFTAWGGSTGGGSFAYTRSTAPAADVPPSVSITNPANGASFVAPATVTVQASASDSDGTVASVQFFANSTSLGSDSTAPFSIVAGSLGVGTYILTARATDNGGLITTSAPITITVSAANQPPSVSITSPTNGATFSAPATITIHASASDSDGSVAAVEFFDGTTLLGTITTSPYTNRVTLQAGAHSLIAVAIDNLGAATASTSVTVSVVTPGTIQFANNLALVSGRLPLRVTVTPGLSYEIDYSSTLTNWLHFTNFVATNAVMNFSAPATATNHRFFRARLLPNP